MMKRFGGFGSKRMKSARRDQKGGKKSGKKSAKGKAGGRTTAKGPVRIPDLDFEELAAKQQGDKPAPKGGGLRLPGLG
jgi:hypothetical protein